MPSSWTLKYFDKTSVKLTSFHGLEEGERQSTYPTPYERDFLERRGRKSLCLQILVDEYILIYRI
jgi:hypothetical protein